MGQGRRTRLQIRRNRTDEVAWDAWLGHHVQFWVYWGCVEFNVRGLVQHPPGFCWHADPLLLQPLGQATPLPPLLGSALTFRPLLCHALVEFGHQVLSIIDP
jgi:hypothetical protein